MLLPVLRSPRPKVAVVVDTSGSMSAEDLAAALREVEGVVKAVGSEIALVSCDAAAGETQRVQKASNARLTGGGGTDMRVGIAAALAARQRPSVVLVLTDGWTPWPDKELPVPLVIGMTRKHECSRPAWARVVDIEL